MRRILAAAALGASLVAPAAFAQTACDLSTSTTCTINGAIFAQMLVPVQQADQTSFLRLMSGGGTTETGSNTTGLAVSSLQQVMVNGTLYRAIGIDLNQNQANPLISLDTLQIFGSNSNTGGATGTPLFDLGTNFVTLRAGANGTSAGDAWFLIPDALVSSFQFLFLNAGFGQHNAANGGFEEFFTTRNATVFAVPEPSIAWLLGLGFVGLIALRRKRFFS